MQYIENSGCFPRGGKQADIGALLPSFVFFFLLAAFSCFYTISREAYSFTTDGHGIFKVRTNLGACHIHTKGCQAQTSLHKSRLGGTKKCPSPCPVRELKNPGSLDLNYDQGSHRLSVTKFHDFSRNFPGPNMFFQGL